MCRGRRDGRLAGVTVSVGPALLQGDCEVPALGPDLAIRAEHGWAGVTVLHLLASTPVL
jgi:hypothetical protein